jgi:hypothetical protein
VSLEGLTGARGREVAGRAGSREPPAITAGVDSLVMSLIRVRVVTLLVEDWVFSRDTGGLVDCGRGRSTKDERAGDLFSQLWINCWTLLARGVDDRGVTTVASLTDSISPSSSICVKSTTVSCEGGVLMVPLTELKSDARLSMRGRNADCRRMSGYSRVK